jgi:hypothetical protein
MILNPRELLRDFDKHAAEYNFPVFDNAYLEFAASRLSAFTSSESWLTTFEVLGFSTRESEFLNDLYAYGSCVKTEGFQGEELLIASDRERSLFDRDTNVFAADWSDLSFKLLGETIRLRPSKDDYLQANLAIDRPPGPGSLTEAELLRFLVHRFGDHLFLGDADLLARFPQCVRMRKFLQTTSWQHPDVSAGDLPSENPSIRSLVSALIADDPSIFDPAQANTDWTMWVANNQSEG